VLPAGSGYGYSGEGKRPSGENIVRAAGWKRVWALLLAVILIRSAAARALREPWVRQLAVLQSAIRL
jgi:hypothetical protein